MVTAIVVKLELGHVAQALEVVSQSGHTHQWKVFVKGADGIDIEHFVEKVVFWLHESYEQPKCVVKHPPYEVQKSGYAGFNILIDIHFKNKSEPRTVRFHYDLFLHKKNMPPVNHTRVEMLTFTNPAEDFKKRLIRAGGIIKVQESQSPRKDKKSEKDSHHSDQKKQRNAGKEKYDHDNWSHKSMDGAENVERKFSKQNWKNDERWKDDASEKEFSKKKKNEIKQDKTMQPGLFSLEESINMKQIKKKDATSGIKDERRKTSKSSDKKVRKDITNKQENRTENKKKEKKYYTESKKSKDSQEKKPKKRRTVSSSSMDIVTSKKSAYSQVRSDSNTDSEEEQKQVDKRQKLPQMKMKKSSKKNKEGSKSNRHHAFESNLLDDNTVVTDMEICTTPPRSNIICASDKEKTMSSVNHSERVIMSSSGNKMVMNDVKKESSRSSQEKSHQSLPSFKISAKKKEKKSMTSHIPSKEEKKEMELIDSDASGASPQSSPRSFLSSPLNPVPQLLLPLDHEPSADDSSEDTSVSMEPHTDMRRPHVSKDITDLNSDSESGVFCARDENINLMKISNEVNDNTPSNESRLQRKQQGPTSFEEPVPLVTVGIGTQLKKYPGLTDEIFEQLQELQNVLASISDQDKLNKIASIVRKCGHFTMEGEIMDFDLCTLDMTTIRKLQKNFKAL